MQLSESSGLSSRASTAGGNREMRMLTDIRISYKGFKLARNLLHIHHAGHCPLTAHGETSYTSLHAHAHVIYEHWNGAVNSSGPYLASDFPLNSQLSLESWKAYLTSAARCVLLWAASVASLLVPEASGSLTSATVLSLKAIKVFL